MENYKRGKKIAEDISKRRCSDEVRVWLEANRYAPEVLQNIMDEQRFEALYGEFSEEVSPLEADRLVVKINRNKNRRRNVIRFSVVFAAALLAVSFLLFVDDEVPIPKVSNRIATHKVEFDTPTLVLDNGVNVNLASDPSTIAIAGNLTIRNSGSVLEYDNVASSESHRNKLILPKMVTYTLKLSDGTEVFLNANSELHYPVAFNGEVREVFLKGEAYFSVTKSDQPFIVSGEKGSVKVYGTEFNVNLRSDDFISAVLVEGSVGVSVHGMEQKEVVLKPSEMAVMNVNDGSSVVKNVDTGRYTAWMSGFFRCDTEPLTVLLESLSNWFDVSFEYNDTSLQNVVVSASLNMNKPLDEIIRLVEIISDVKFIKIEQNGYRIESKK